MRLIQAKVRCVEGVRDTGWMIPGKETTVVLGPRNSGKTSLLLALQALNPPYDVSLVKPFTAHPPTWQQGSYARQVIPEKKTAVVMVFAAAPDQVVRLAEIDDDLIETDRIEVGRRLDYSRWTSFVEIPASSRWRQIADDMEILRRAAAHRHEGAEEPVFPGLHSSDRLQGDTAAECLRWLGQIEPVLPAEEKSRHQQCLYQILRRERFRRAESQVAGWLPLTLYLDPEWEVPQCVEYGEIMSGQLRRQIPVLADLLHMLCRKHNLPQSGATFEELLAAAAGRTSALLELFFTSNYPFPAISSDRERIFFTNIPETVLEKRFYLAALTCLVAQLCHETRPLLLCDCFDRGLSAEQRPAMLAFQQQLGGWCQLLAAADETTVAGTTGWQSVQRIDPGGLAESGLTPA